jgi:hypothetical protein
LHPQWLVTAVLAYDSFPVSDTKGLIYVESDRMTVGLAYAFMDVGIAAVNERRGPRPEMI